MKPTFVKFKCVDICKGLFQKKLSKKIQRQAMQACMNQRSPYPWSIWSHSMGPITRESHHQLHQDALPQLVRSEQPQHAGKKLRFRSYGEVDDD